MFLLTADDFCIHMNTKKFKFPEVWSLNIRSKEELAARLQYETEKLQRIIEYSQSVFYPRLLNGRRLLIPSAGLKEAQRRILYQLLGFKLPPHVHGGIKGKSIKTNAQVHQRQPWVACFDIRQFFPTVHFSNVERVFLGLGCSVSVARILTQLTTFDYQLPQGAPTSPMLANLLLYPLDLRMISFMKKAGFRYTRYFDDLAISGRRNPESFIGTIEKIITQEGYELHPEKIRIMSTAQEQIVTGLVVNSSKLCLPRSVTADIEEQIRSCKAGDFPKEYLENPFKYKDSLRGKISFLENVNPKTGKRLRKKFEEVEWIDSV